MSEAVNILLPLLSEEQREKRQFVVVYYKASGFFSLFTLEHATWDRTEMRTSQSGTCGKVGRKWQ